MSLCDIQLNVGIVSFTGEGWLSVSCGSSPGDKTAEGQLEGLTDELLCMCALVCVCGCEYSPAVYKILQVRAALHGLWKY